MGFEEFKGAAFVCPGQQLFLLGFEMTDGRCRFDGFCR